MILIKNIRKDENELFRERAKRVMTSPPCLIGFGTIVALVLFWLGSWAVDALLLWIPSWQTTVHGEIIEWQIPGLFSFQFLGPWWCYGMIVIFSLLAGARFAWVLKTSLSPLADQNQKGNRAWTSEAALRKEYISIPDNGEAYAGSGGFPVSHFGSHYLVDNSPVNNLILGTTRSGKGELFVVPAIDIYSRAQDPAKRPSLIVSDPKGELAAASLETLQKRGYEVHILDLIHFCGMGYNPLELIYQEWKSNNTSAAQTLAKTVASTMFADPSAHDKTWQNWSIALTTALILAVVADSKSRETVNMYSVARLLVDYGNVDAQTNRCPLDDWMRARNANDPARLQYASVEFGSDKTKGNIFANTLAVLSQFTLHPLARMTSYHSLDLGEVGFGRKPVAIFLVTPDYDRSNDFLLAIFISQLYYVLAKKAGENGQKCKREVCFLLDEFGNVPAIPNMDGMITVCLGRNIRFTLIVQSYSQLYRVYGKDAAQTILSNCGNQIYLMSTDEETARHFSSLLGNKTVVTQSRSRQGGPFSLKGASASEHIDSQPLLSPTELMELRPGECVLVRPMKRTNQQGQAIQSLPVFNRGRTRMPYRYQNPVMSKAFDTRNPYPLEQLKQNCPYFHQELDGLVFHPNIHIPVNREEKGNGSLSQKQISKLEKLLRGFGLQTEADSIRWMNDPGQIQMMVNDLLDTEELTQEQFEECYQVLEGGA